MQIIADEGRGVVLYLRREEHGVDLFAGVEASSGQPSTNPGLRLNEFRDYGIGAQILRDLGVGKIRLLTNHPRRLVSLPGYGLEIVERVPLSTAMPPPPSDEGSAKLAKIR
jgi:3,4-dihydroxy 2-butanone 4-phosphate synthase/GTP cyclohydrolase II